MIQQLRTMNQDRTVFYHSQALCFVPLYATITGFRGKSYEQVVLPIGYQQLMYKSKNHVIVEGKYSIQQPCFIT